MIKSFDLFVSFCHRRLAAPTTWGTAILVPDVTIVSPNAPVALTASPGATTSTSFPVELKSLTSALESTEPTATTFLNAAGYSTLSVPFSPWFPAAAITKIPFALASSIACFKASEYWFVPKLMLIIFTFLSMAQ